MLTITLCFDKITLEIVYMFFGGTIMDLKQHFIKATEEYNSFEKNVPAYYFRRSFNVQEPKKVKITVAVCGIYELYFNGKNITKGFLSPYISNPNHYIYYDEYSLSLEKGENVIGVWLGNGFQNNPGGHIWEFEKASYRSAPMFALSVTEESNGNILLLSDESFKTSSSPILTDDYRFGEYYDANLEINGWNEKGFDDSAWGSVLCTACPDGELRLADIEPIVEECELKPVCIMKRKDCYIYDFGVCNAGVCRLKINGEKGQKVVLRYADSLLDNGDINLAQVWFEREHWERDKQIVHKDTYVLKGNGEETYQSHFTYHGFRYVKIEGITEQQATEDLLTYVVLHTKLETMGNLNCSDPIFCKLQEIARRSIVSNFHHFPTDCPQREKNGWTADAALSSVAVLLNFNPERNYREWMRNICKAQNNEGALPGIVPTAGWGFDWGNGPAWDCVLAYLPYYTYIYRGKTDMIKESATSFVSYLKYLRTRTDKNGLLSIGLGDWCSVNRPAETPKAPLIVTDSVIAMDIAYKMAEMFKAVNMEQEYEYAYSEAGKYKKAIRDNLIDYKNMCVFGECQTTQAMGLYYNVFNESEKELAFKKLLEITHNAGDIMDFGVLGARIFFRVLSEFGESDLAYKMATRTDIHSYGLMIKQGATALWETIDRSTGSVNHHFWCDIVAWFMECVVGIKLNPNKNNLNEVLIKPAFVKALDFAEAYHKAPAGKISVLWERDGNNITVKTEIPLNVTAKLVLPKGYAFKNGATEKLITTGEYTVESV